MHYFHSTLILINYDILVSPLHTFFYSDLFHYLLLNFLFFDLILLLLIPIVSYVLLHYRVLILYQILVFVLTMMYPCNYFTNLILMLRHSHLHSRLFSSERQIQFFILESSHRFNGLPLIILALFVYCFIRESICHFVVLSVNVFYWESASFQMICHNAF